MRTITITKTTAAAALALTLVSALLALHACFSPSLGDEAFQCNRPPHECPEGYVCVEHGPGDRSCMKEGVTPPRPDLGPPDAKPGPDAAVGPVCDSPVKAADGHTMADLVVDGNDTPHIVFIDDQGHVRQAYLTGGTFKVVDPQVSAAGTVRAVDAAVSGDLLHIAYIPHGTVQVRHCFKPAATSQACAKDNELPPSLFADSVKVYDGLAVDASGKDILMTLGYTTTQALNNVRSALIRFSPTDATPSNFTYSLVCTKQPSGNPKSIESSSIALGATHGAASFWLDPTIANGWQIASFANDVAGKGPCDSTYTNLAAENGLPYRLPVATEGNKIFAVHVRTAKVSDLLGEVRLYEWSHASIPLALNTLTPALVHKPKSAVLLSAGLAVFDGKPVVTLIEDSGGSVGRKLVVRYPDSQGAWLDLPVTMPAGYKAAGHTQIVARSAPGSLHIGFQTIDASSKVAIHYIRCKGSF